MELHLRVWDERGQELQAICSLVDLDTRTWDVILSDLKGQMGSFRVKAPAGSTLEEAIIVELKERAIHALTIPGITNPH
ncbi:hypothetical protein [Dyella acidiphila]|uniref:Uncharacterized protein n=1 Tax=Dyella acidiphila TaxID=2775866 RepID=A0ABR9G6H2_9GAMM|nr:hypothetical protein [Dyella acidiphila]MBE1159644.1 hypothetical protein [Dyella acidiphila]